MNISELPKGNHPKAIEFPHFPTAYQAVIWRNWGLVPAERLCKVLDCTREELDQTASNMGLPLNPLVNPLWVKRSCNTLLRANWHLLEYDQLLTLLDWTADEMANQLQWDDFLWAKLGFHKPACTRPRYRPLTSDEMAATEKLRKVVQRHFPGDEIRRQPQPFSFYDNLPDTPTVAISQPAEGLRLAYSYSARYGDPLLDESLNPYPEKLLIALRSKGVNAVYLQGILTQLTPFADLPEISVGYETRVCNLNKLIDKAGRYGISVYLYLNEPRGFTQEQLNAHPELIEKYSSPVDVDMNVFGMCTSKPAVREHLQNSLRYLAQHVPGLAGVFTIVCSENLTNCWSHQDEHTVCPVCNAKGAPAVYADVNAMIAQALHSVNPDIRILCWNWGFYHEEWKPEFIKLLPSDVTLLCTSESDMPIEIAGVKNRIGDYSISRPGPGPCAKQLWQQARQRGLQTAAKIMLSNSWELSAVPYIPATFLVEQHLNNLRQLGIKDYFISWTLGGWPSINMELLNKTHDQMVIDNFGASALTSITRALQEFSSAFQQFPFEHNTLYRAPHNAGPTGLLYATPTGYKATMVGYPYDDLKAQRQSYPEEIFENQWKLLSDQWREKGIKALLDAAPTIAPEYQDAYNDLLRIAWACWCHFRSAYNQFAFHRRRNNPDALPHCPITQFIKEEIDIAKRMLALTLEDSRLGFEATNHYAYSPNDLREKVINCEYLLET